MTERRFRGIPIGFFLLFLGIFTSSCETTKPKVPIELVLTGTPQLNPSETGQPLPVIVRIYTLGDNHRFERATFNELWKRDSEFLERDFLNRKELTLYPYSTEVLEIDMDYDRGERYIAVMGMFRKFSGTWRITLPIDPPGFFSFGHQKFEIMFDKNEIRIIEENMLSNEDKQAPH